MPLVKHHHTTRFHRWPNGEALIAKLRAMRSGIVGALNLSQNETLAELMPVLTSRSTEIRSDAPDFRAGIDAAVSEQIITLDEARLLIPGYTEPQ